jgi:tetraacyldisaccharide 4'-kinase
MGRGSRTTMLRTHVTDIMTRGDDYPICSLATPLWAISVIYGALALLKRRLYARGTLKSLRLPCPVISVGNLTLGGTGKTPMVIHLAERLQGLGYRPVILSRGYKGLAEKNGAVVSDGRNLLCDARQAGDEPYLMASMLPAVPVVVGGNRYRIGTEAVRQFHPDMIILDDGYQHLQLKRDLNILLLDARRPFGNGHVLPRGTLREPAASLLDADAVVLTRSGQARGRTHDEWARRVHPRPVFTSDHQPVVRLVLAAGQPAGGLPADDRPDLDADFKGRRVFAFAGLGCNDAFFQSIELSGTGLHGTLGFDDHHPYTGDDLNRVAKAAGRASATCLMTTDKDYVRLPRGTRLPLDLIVMGVRMDFGAQQMTWRAYIERVVRELVER